MKRISELRERIEYTKKQKKIFGIKRVEREFGEGSGKIAKRGVRGRKNIAQKTKLLNKKKI